MSKATKIVVTIGPATESEEQLTALIQAGMNVARFNTKHSDPQWHKERIERVKRIATQLEAPVAVLLDLQGPEVRIDLPNQEAFEVKQGERVYFSHDRSNTQPHVAYVPMEVVHSIEVGNSLLLEDGASEFKIVDKNSSELIAEAAMDCWVKPRKTMNTPGIVLDMPSLTDRDISYLDTVNPADVDFIGLSYVRTKTDIDLLKQEMATRQFDAHIISKIENQQALDNIDELIEASDAVMVARGDLGVEVPFQELIYWQKAIISKCRMAAKPVITATEMLKSMMDKPRPTRAEVSDVAHAIYDGTDAIMLSDETTIGKYPVKCVETQRLIAEYNEPHATFNLGPVQTHDNTATMAQAAISILENSNLPIDKIMCLTETGQTARLISRFHPDVPIFALTHYPRTFYTLGLAYGVIPILFKQSSEIFNEEVFIAYCKEHGIADQGENILLVRGKFWQEPGLTNTITIIKI